MPLEKIESFVDKVLTDAELRHQIMGAANRDEWLSIARQAGFAFSTREYGVVLNRLAGRVMQQELSRELSEAGSSRRVNGFGGQSNQTKGKPAGRASPAR